MALSNISMYLNHFKIWSAVPVQFPFFFATWVAEAVLGVPVPTGLMEPRDHGGSFFGQAMAAYKISTW